MRGQWLPRSLFGRLLLAQIANILVLAIILPVILSHTLAATADSFIAARLARTADQVARQVEAPGDSTRIPDSSAWRGGRSFALLDPEGKILLRSPKALPEGILHMPRPGEKGLERHGRYDVLTRPLLRGGVPVGRIVVAQDRTVPDEIVDDVVDEFLGHFLWVLPLALLASLFVSLVVMRRVTGNFRRAASQADLIGLTRLDARIDEARLPSEATPLVHATNRAIARLEAGYHEQGEFVGNVAHELRTPLALLSLHTEQLPGSPQRDQLQADIEKANHVVRQLMELAAIDRLHPECRPVDSIEVARRVVESMVSIVYNARHSISLEMPDERPPPVQAVSELLEIALTNLIDNAVRHTPEGCIIWVVVEANGCLVVEDDGPGIDFDDNETGRRRFRRGGTARTDSAGLGLSIVERIMTVCGGALEVERAPNGGARIRLRMAPVDSRNVDVSS
ncbi:signal transduction histidine kinase [Novosphingobium sp. PhB165]|uniref:sensor histidine kinase n=1 Tax=Novosphingobium sp. PhB165 TaxID=2485105 RepID=UPI001047E1AF|nr:ATP-binding protein [Novosphingobium sp. PhB165]TCM22106.1 signal transduction histidine kinase [Novosphingobium sp. PhB165]